MYNVLVVEDEKYTREKVVKYLKEDLFEYFNIYAADDGTTALEFMETTEVHVVVTDIMMQFMDGIELAEKIHAAYKECIVIILSGYDEFEYAQKAISFNVRQYFLKPFDLSKLSEEIMSYKEELDKKHKKTFDYFGEESSLRAEFLTNYIYNKNQAIFENYKNVSFPFDFENTPCDIILLKVDDYESFLADKWYYGADSFLSALNNLVIGFLENRYAFCIRSENGYFEYLIFHNGRKTDYADLVKKIEAISNVSVNLYKRIEKFKNIKEIPQRKKEVADTEKPAFSFILNIKKKNYSEAKKIFVNARENEHSWESFKNILFKFGLETEDDVDLSDDSLLEKYNAVLENNEDTENMDDNIFISIERAKKYIQENYDKNLLRDDVAKAAYFSSSYFTKNFKIYTGESFSDYLLKVRMENAVRLMKLDKYNVTRIAEMVGYQNPKYFFRVFKMYYGYTPTEYLRRVLKLPEKFESKEVPDGHI